MICKAMHKKHHVLAGSELQRETKGKKTKNYILKRWRCTFCYRTWTTREYLRD